MILKSQHEVTPLVHFDNTSISSWKRCERFFYFSNVQSIRPKTPSIPLDFGAKIHLALEEWYKTWDKESAIKIFEDGMSEFTNFDEKRNPQRGRIILEDYFLRYPKEAEQFSPILQGDNHETELSFAIPVWPEIPEVHYTGRIDLVVKHHSFGILCIDHKTTSEMGESFFRMVKPNRQFAGYIWALRQYFPSVWGAMVNAIFVGVTKKMTKAHQAMFEVYEMAGDEVGMGRILSEYRNTRFAREFTTRTEDELKWWQEDTIHYISKIYEAFEKWNWPQNTNSCTYYGQCPFYELCTSPRHFMELEPSDDRYEENTWNPLEVGK